MLFCVSPIKEKSNDLSLIKLFTYF